MKKVIISFLVLDGIIIMLFIFFMISLFIITSGIEYGWFENYDDYKTVMISTESEYYVKVKIPNDWIIEEENDWLNIKENNEIIARQLYHGGWTNYSFHGVDYNNWYDLEFNPNVSEYAYNFSFYTYFRGSNSSYIYEINYQNQTSYALFFDIVEYKNKNVENIIFIFEKNIDINILDKIKKSSISSGTVYD